MYQVRNKSHVAFDTDYKWWFISAIIKWLMTGWRELERRDQKRENTGEKCKTKMQHQYVLTPYFSPNWGLLVQECVYPNVYRTR